MNNTTLGNVAGLTVRRCLSYAAHGRRSWLIFGLIGKLGDLRHARAAARWRPEVIYIWNPVGLSNTLLKRVCRGPTKVAVYVAYTWLLDLQRAAGHPDPWFHQMYRALQWILGSRARRPLRWLLHRASDWALYADEYHFDSEALAARHNVSSAVVIAHGVDLRRFNGARLVRRDHPRQPFRALYVGRVSPEKGVECAIRAVEQTKTPVSLTIAGPVEEGYQARFHRLLVASSAAASIAFLGQVARSELPNLYWEHDVLLFLSEYEEPFGLVLVEAMASALPIVSTCQGGSKAVAPAGEVSLEVPPGDAGQVAKAVDRIASDFTMWRSLSTAGLKRASQFDLRALTDQVEERLLRLAGRS